MEEIVSEEMEMIKEGDEEEDKNGGKQCYPKSREEWLIQRGKQMRERRKGLEK